MCNECLTIASDIRNAFVEAWLSSDEASKDAWFAIRNLLGGNEEDVLRAEELVPKFDMARSASFPHDQRQTDHLVADTKSSASVRRALSAKFTHEARTGHKVGWGRSAT